MTQDDGLVEVAPREITDVVFYCCRVAGVDAGTAHLIADNVTAAEIAHSGAIDSFAAKLDGPTSALLDEWAVDKMDFATGDEQFEDRRQKALRGGLRISPEVLASLKAASSRFLVSEAAVDDAVANS